MTVALPKLTFEDYVAFPEDGRRHELIDGEHYVSAAPNVRHQTILGNLYAILRELIRKHDLGWLWFGPLAVKLSEVDVVEPDLLFLARAHGDRRTGTHLDGPPDLVVEVLSESNRRHDEVTKRRLYDRAGVEEYWIVDPVLESVKVYRRGNDGAFDRAVELAAERGERLETPLLPGLSVALADLFGS